MKYILTLLITLTLCVSCVTSPNMQSIYVTSNVSSQILNLRNSGNGNTSTTTADHVMKNGFLSTGEEYGYYTLYLRSEYVDDRWGYFTFMVFIGIFTLGILYLLGAPVDISEFNLSVSLDILDSNMKTIRSYSDSTSITQAGGVYYGDSTDKASAAFTRLIRNVQRRASADSDFINTALLTAGPIGGRRTVSVPSTPTVPQRQPQQNDIVGALDNAARVIMNSLQERNLRNQKIAIVNVSSFDREQSVFVAGELEYILVQNRFTIVDRIELDRIRREQNFQLSGEVDDDQIVSIGKFAGAGLVITGSITGSGSMRRLRLRVLDTQSAELRGSASEPF